MIYLILILGLWIIYISESPTTDKFLVGMICQFALVEILFQFFQKTG